MERRPRTTVAHKDQRIIVVTCDCVNRPGMQCVICWNADRHHNWRNVDREGTSSPMARDHWPLGSNLAQSIYKASGRNRITRDIASPRESDLRQVGLRRQICPQICFLWRGSVARVRSTR